MCLGLEVILQTCGGEILTRAVEESVFKTSLDQTGNDLQLVQGTEASSISVAERRLEPQRLCRSSNPDATVTLLGHGQKML